MAVTGKGPATLEDIEAELDKMDQAAAGGESAEPLAGPSDDDLEIIFAPDGGDRGEGDDIEDREAAPGSELAGGAADGEGEGDDDQELSGYSKNVRQRIARADRLRREAETREEGERQARVQAQSRERAANLQAAEATVALLDVTINEKRSQLKVAKEGGKTDDEIKITSELQQLETKKLRGQELIEGLKSAPAHDDTAVNANRATWQTGNKWFQHPEFAVESQLVVAISNDLARKGIAPSSPEHFKRIDEELRSRMPQLAARVRARLGQGSISWGGNVRENNGGRQQDNGARRGAPRLASPGPGFGKPANGKRQVVLTSEDVQNMRKVRLDPNNKEHVLRYASEKQALGNTGGRR